MVAEAIRVNPQLVAVPVPESNNLTDAADCSWRGIRVAAVYTFRLSWIRLGESAMTVSNERKLRLTAVPGAHSARHLHQRGRPNERFRWAAVARQDPRKTRAMGLLVQARAHSERPS